MASFCFTVLLMALLLAEAARATHETDYYGALRLVKGSNTSSLFSKGRLEIFIYGEWGTICDDGFRQTEADVACRQLGFREASGYGDNLGFGSGSFPQPIWLDDVDCDTFDTRIIDCSHDGFGVHNCGHHQDVMINCETSFVPPSAKPHTTASPIDDYGALRLVQGSSTSSSFTAGRLEVFINGQWGTICDDGFGLREADVACGQLGYSSAQQFGSNLRFGLGSSSQPVWLDEVVCSIFDRRIIACDHNGIGNTDCSHSEDIMIDCGRSTTATSDPTPTADSGSGALRLVQGRSTSSSFTAGRLEIFINGEWGTVCNDNFYQTEADVACRQLGYSGASDYGTHLGFSSGSSLQEIWLDEVDCSIFDLRILDCSHNGIGVEDCGHYEDIMIRCIASPTATSDPSSGGALRLVQGSSTSSSFTAGRLEVYLNGEWGTVCDDGFFSTEADVACQQLGYTEANDYGIDLGFGSRSSSQEIWLTNADCSESDSRIVDCSHDGIGVENCVHSEDIMIECASDTSSALDTAIAILVGVGVMCGLCCGIGIWCHRVCKPDRPSPLPQPHRRYRTDPNIATPTTTTAPTTNTTPPPPPRWPIRCYRIDPNIATPTTTKAPATTGTPPPPPRWPMYIRRYRIDPSIATPTTTTAPATTGTPQQQQQANTSTPIGTPAQEPPPPPPPRWPIRCYHIDPNIATPTTTTAPATTGTPPPPPRWPMYIRRYRIDPSIATPTTTTAPATTGTPQQQQANTSTPIGTPAQEPPPPTPTYYASQPVQGRGVEVVDTQNMQARFTSDEPLPYNLAMHYPQVHQRQQNYPQPPAYLTQQSSNTTEEDPLPSAPCLTDQQQDPAPSAPCLTVQQQYPAPSVPCLTDQQQYPPPLIYVIYRPHVSLTSSKNRLQTRTRCRDTSDHPQN